MQRKKAIIHDWDDVVINSFKAYSQFYFDFAEFFNLGLPTSERLKRHWGKPIPQIIRGQWSQLSENVSEQMVNDFIDYRKKAQKTPYQVKIFPGVIDAFKELTKNFKLAILTSGYKPTVERIYREMIHPDIKYHEIVMGPPELKVYKPDPRAFDLIFECFKKQGISERETIYIGDNIIDFNAARNRGLEFYAVTTGVTSKENFLEEGLNESYIIDKFTDILPIFKKQNEF